MPLSNKDAISLWDMLQAIAEIQFVGLIAFAYKRGKERAIAPDLENSEICL